MLERIMRPARPAIVACMFALGRNWTFDSAIGVSAKIGHVRRNFGDLNSRHVF